MMFYGFQCTSAAHIPEYILSFDATVNGTVFLILFLDYLFLVEIILSFAYYSDILQHS